MQNFIHNGLHWPRYDKPMTLYITAIGNEADEVLNKAFIKLCLYNPRIVISKFGNMKATKYSFRFEDRKQYQIITNSLFNMINYDMGFKILVENRSRNNLYVIKNIVYPSKEIQK